MIAPASLRNGSISFLIDTAIVSSTGQYGMYPFVVQRPRKSRRVKQFEIIWRPMCLSIFKYGGALPVGKYTLICTPYNASGNNYQIRSVEIPKAVPVAKNQHLELQLQHYHSVCWILVFIGLPLKVKE